jgi:kynurenine formamidase
MLSDSYEITVQDLQNALRRQNLRSDLRISSPVHQILLAVNGIHILESLKLDELAMKRANEFAFILEPLKLKGATDPRLRPLPFARRKLV